MADLTNSPPTASGIRWYVLVVATLSSVLLYLDRICVSFAVESIRVEFGATQRQMSWFLGAFFWSYALGQVPAGWLSDRFGIRRMLTIYILLWSVFTALLGLSTGIVTLLGYRLGCGLAQAGAYPSCAKAVRDWMPLMQRGLASSIVAFGGRIGGAIAPLLTGAIMLWVALATRDPALTPDEILDPSAIQTVLQGESEQDSPWLDEICQESKRFIGHTRKMAEAPAWSPFDDRADLASFLNYLEPVSLLASVAEVETLELPTALRLAVDSHRERGGEPHTQESDLANRQIWEAALPGAVKKLESRGWRMTLVIYGSLGIFVAGLFWIVFRDDPERHPWANAAEVSLIGNVQPQTTTSLVKEPFPWLAMITDLGLWGNCLCQAMTNIGWLFLVTWFPRYLTDVHQVPVLERGLMASIPIFSGMIGMLAGGPWTDRWTARFGLRWGRRLPIVSSRIVATFGYVVCGLAATGLFGEPTDRASAWIAVAGLSIVAIATDLGVAATWAYAQDIAGRHTAAILGWGNMWGNLGAAVAPPLYNLFLGETPGLSDWRWLFVFCGGSFLVSAGGGWLMDSSRPLSSTTNLGSHAEDQI